MRFHLLSMTIKSTIEMHSVPSYFAVTSKLCRCIQVFLNATQASSIHSQTAPHLSKYRLVDMFTSVTDESVKKNKIRNFTSPSGNCRVVIGAIAFRMGLDSLNVCKVIHWGPSSDIESYVQENDRIGRDDLPAVAVLYYKKLDLTKVKAV